MLIVAIGHGGKTDPFVCSCEANSYEVNVNETKSVLNHIVRERKLVREDIDEVMVVHDDKVIRLFDWSLT